jgi:hypothetical protein
MIEALGIAIVKNEADVIEPFVRHNLGFMDALFIADNDSVDGTREILVQLQREGLPIVLFDDPIVGHFQAEKVTAMYRRVVPEFKPRFVFLLDADEFIVAPSRSVLDHQLRAIPPGSQAQYYWRTYIPAPTGPEGDIADPLRSIVHRRISEDPWTKSIIVTEPKIDMKLKVQQGNHDVELAGKLLPAVKLRDVALAHFPVRSIDQTSGKALVGWITNMESNRHRPGGLNGLQKKLLYERIVQGPGLTAEDLTFEALKYAQSFELVWPQDVVREPVAPGYMTLTAQPETTCTPLQKVVRCVDNILNPDANSSESMTAPEFLRDSNRKSTTWRDFLPSSVTGNELRGVFTQGRHAQKAQVDLPPFRHLAERDRPISVLEIGCGSGAYLKYFASHGTQSIRGVDSVDGGFGYLQPDEYTCADLGESIDVSNTFDLVICMDVIENIPVSSERVAIDNIVRHANKRIVFSSARPGQPGASHINCRRISHWLDAFSSAGWYPCLFDSLALRSLSTFPSLRSNLVVLTQDSSDVASARARLMELEKRKINWRAKHPAVITHPFTTTASELPKGKVRWLTTLRSR